MGSSSSDATFMPPYNGEVLDGQDMDLLAHGSAGEKFCFLVDHVHHLSHAVVIVPRCARVVPVPIGGALPSRSDASLNDRYAKLMLILFKPWRSLVDLRGGSDNWADAFHNFVSTGVCSIKVSVVMDNMELVLQCKAARDSHATRKTSRLKHIAIDKREVLEMEEDEYTLAEEEGIVLEDLHAQDALYS